MRKYTVLVVNGIFEDENLLIIKSTGSQSVIRIHEMITPELLDEHLERQNISKENSAIHVVVEDWRGRPKIETFA